MVGEGANGWTGSLAGDQRSSPNRESHGCHVVEREGETERERERKKEGETGSSGQAMQRHLAGPRS